ncbi:Dihydrolipoyl dehydrogenase [anaerobic digester metagenome]
MNIVVIGGGPAGRTAAMEASELGANVTLIEKNKIGGKCLNEGCVVVCGLNDVAKYIRNTKKFNERGITSLNPEINFHKVAGGVKETIAKIRHVLEVETREAGVNVVMGDAVVGDGYVSVGSENYDYDKLIIGTGAGASIPPVKGAEHALTYRDVLDIPKVPKNLNIVGSGVIAAEFAGIFSAMGSRVRIFCRHSFLKMLDPDIKRYVVEKLLGDVEIIENTQVNEIHPDGLKTDAGFFEGTVLIAVGMVPNSDAVRGLVDTGKNGEIIVNSKMETSKRGVYAAGDVVGGIGTTPVARMEGVVAARNSCGIHAEADYRFVPSSISLHYDVSFLKSESPTGSEGHIPGSSGPETFWRVLDGETGMSKVVFDAETGDINSLFAVSPSARTTMAYMSKFLRDGYKIHDFDNFIETHPSTDAVYKLIRFLSKLE